MSDWSKRMLEKLDQYDRGEITDQTAQRIEAANVYLEWRINGRHHGDLNNVAYNAGYAYASGYHD